MASSQSGPYQSKAFSYVVRQTMRWVDRGKVALRQLKVTADWTAQMILYPVYVAVQSARLAGAQVQKALELAGAVLRSPEPTVEQSSLPSPTGSLTVDTPIQQALLVVQNFSLPINLPVQLEQTSLVLNYVRGLATRLETKSLVLVTCHNQLLDILTPPQQKQLDRRIAWEIAHYERYQRIRQTAHQALSSLRPLLEEGQKLPPVLALRQSIATRLQVEPVQQVGIQLKQLINWSLPKLQVFSKASITFGEAMRDRFLPGTPVLLPSADIQLRQILWKAKT
ncbi:MAG: hypothetical protein WCA35_07255, partial [Kovacikia sp.]